MFWPDDYLKRVAQQIRVKRIREPLTEELRDHMLLQKADYMAAGLAESEAERKTTEDMGDSLLVGGELDAAHRPASQWKGILIAVLLLLLGLGIQMVNGALAGASFMDTLGGNRAFFTALALVPLCLFAFSDYAIWIRWSPLITVAWLLCAVYRITSFKDVEYAQTLRYVFNPTWFQFIVPQVLSTGLPLVTALLVCRQRGHGWSAFFLCLAPVLTLMLLCWVFRNTGYDIAPCMLMAAVGLCILAIAVKDSFFRITKHWAYVLLVGLIVLAVAFSIICFTFQPENGEMRILIDAIISGARPVGSSVNVIEVSTTWKHFVDMGYGLTDYTLPAIIAYAGWIPSSLLIVGLVVLLFWCVYRFSRLENRMGALLGMASALTLCLQALIYVPASFGLIGEHLCLPFLSYGHAVLIVDATLVGIMLGVMRGINLPEPIMPLCHSHFATME